MYFLGAERETASLDAGLHGRLRTAVACCQRPPRPPPCFALHPLADLELTDTVCDTRGRYSPVSDTRPHALLAHTLFRFPPLSTDFTPRALSDITSTSLARNIESPLLRLHFLVSIWKMRRSGGM